MNYKRRESERAFNNGLPDGFPLTNKVTNQNVKLMNNKDYEKMFFECQSDLLKIRARKTGFDLSMLTITPRKPDRLSNKKVNELINHIQEILYTCLRKTDQVFVSLKNKDLFSIILLGTHVDHINIVIDKIRETIIESGLFSDDDFLFNYNSLYKYKIESV